MTGGSSNSLLLVNMYIKDIEKECKYICSLLLSFIDRITLNITNDIVEHHTKIKLLISQIKIKIDKIKEITSYKDIDIFKLSTETIKSDNEKLNTILINICTSINTAINTANNKSLEETIKSICLNLNSSDTEINVSLLDKIYNALDFFYKHVKDQYNIFLAKPISKTENLKLSDILKQQKTKREEAKRVKKEAKRVEEEAKREEDEAKQKQLDEQKKQILQQKYNDFLKMIQLYLSSTFKFKSTYWDNLVDYYWNTETMFFNKSFTIEICKFTSMFSDNTDPTHESNKVVSIINYTYLKPYMCTIQEFIEQKYFGILYTLNKIQKIKIKCDEFNTSFMYEFKLNIPREFSIDEIKLQSTYNIDDKSIEKINEYIKIHFEKSKEFIDEKEKKNRDAIEELKEIAQKQITEL